MSDIVEKLTLNAGHYTTSIASERLLREAADAIKTLEARIDLLEAELERTKAKLRAMRIHGGRNG